MINLVRFRLEKLIKFKFVAQSEDFSSEEPVLSRRRQKLDQLGLVRPLGGPTASDTNLLFASSEGPKSKCNQKQGKSIRVLEMKKWILSVFCLNHGEFEVRIASVCLLCVFSLSSVSPLCF